MTDNGALVLKQAPNFKLQGADGIVHSLEELCDESTLLLVFYPGGPIKPTCKSQLCDYRDNYDQFKAFHVNIVAISNDTTENQVKFAQDNEYPFMFLTDPGNAVAKSFNAKSFLMVGTVSRAIFIISKKSLILYRYVEPTWLTRRGSPELLSILKDLETNNLL